MRHLKLLMLELDKSKPIYVARWCVPCTSTNQTNIILLNQGYQVVEFADCNEEGVTVLAVVSYVFCNKRVQLSIKLGTNKISIE